MLNSGVTGFRYESKLGKSSDDLCSITGNSVRRSLHTHTAKVRNNRLFGNYSAKSLELPLYTTLYTHYNLVYTLVYYNVHYTTHTIT